MVSTRSNPPWGSFPSFLRALSARRSSAFPRMPVRRLFNSCRKTSAKSLDHSSALLQEQFRRFAGNERAGVPSSPPRQSCTPRSEEHNCYSRGYQGFQGRFTLCFTHDHNTTGAHTASALTAESSCTGWPPPCNPDSSASSTTPGVASSKI
jgi:hypothetical protein